MISYMLCVIIVTLLWSEVMTRYITADTMVRDRRRK